jgi:hypothetical protein
VACPGAAGCFALVTSVPLAGGFRLPDDEYSSIADNKEWRAPAGLPDPATLPAPAARKYALSLVSLNDRTCSLGLASDEHALEEYDVPVELRVCRLATKETGAGKKLFMVLGVVSSRGEDRPVKSRCLVFSTVSLVPEPGQPASSGLRLKLLATHEMKTCLSAVCPVAGHLALTSGHKTIVHEFEDNDQLTGVAFTDSGVHQLAAASAKNFLWLGDAAGRGVGLYAFQERPPKMVELGRCIDAVEMAHPVLALGCMATAAGQMSAVALGAGGRASFFVYAPASMTSHGGTRLRHDGVFQLGMARVLPRVLSVALPDGSIGLLLAGPSGAVSVLLPLVDADADQSYRLLVEAQARVVAELPHAAGLHPRVCRGAPANRHMVDLGLLAGRFVALPRLVQERLAGSSGRLRRVVRAVLEPLQARVLL